MSTGFSGNLGFPMPENWSFGQFYETSIGSGSGYLEIDKNDYSGRDTGASSFNPVLDYRDETEQVLFEKWREIVATIPVLGIDPWLLSAGFEFGESITIFDNELFRVDVKTAVEYTTPIEGSNVRIDILNGEIQGEIETILGEEYSFLTVYGMSEVESAIETASVTVDNGFIEVGVAIEDDGIHFQISIFNEDIETPGGTVNLAVRIDFIIKAQFPEIPGVTEDQVERIEALAVSVGLLLAILLIMKLIITSPVFGAAGMIAAIIAYTDDVFKDEV